MARAAKWRNRIVRYANVDPEQLLANPKNWHIHTLRQQNALKKAIDRIGYLDPVIVQDGTDVVIDGHMRVALALREQEATIPVQYVDLNDEEADLILATLDAVRDLAVKDDAKFDKLRSEMKDGGETVEAILARVNDTPGSPVGTVRIAGESTTDEDDGDDREYLLCPYCTHVFPFELATEERSDD